MILETGEERGREVEEHIDERDRLVTFLHVLHRDCICSLGVHPDPDASNLLPFGSQDDPPAD